MESNNRIAELERQGNQALMCENHVWEVRVLTYAFKPKPGANPTGKLARRPMRRVEREAMAAVAVIRLLRTSPLQMMYSVSKIQRSGPLHTQVPPESDKIDALTEICSHERDKRSVSATRVEVGKNTDDVRHGSLVRG